MVRQCAWIVRGGWEVCCKACADGFDRSDETICGAPIPDMGGQSVDDRLPFFLVDLFVDAGVSQNLGIAFRHGYENENACAILGRVEVL